MKVQLSKFVLINEGFEALFETGKQLAMTGGLREKLLQVVNFNIDNLCLRMILGFLVILQLP